MAKAKKKRAKPAAASAPPRPQITSVPPGDAARMLFQGMSEKDAEAALRKTLAAGAPANDDGTINLVNYAAWLVRELAVRGD